MPNKNKIKETFIDPRGKEIILYENTWSTHILDNHPEMKLRYHDLKGTIKDPDHIRKGRDPSNTELYVKQFVADYVFVSTKDIKDIKDIKEITIVTTAYSGKDTNSKGLIKWRK